MAKCPHCGAEFEYDVKKKSVSVKNVKTCQYDDGESAC